MLALSETKYMSHEKLAVVSVRDPLTRTTRRERMSLLGVSAVCIAIAKVGLVPSKISALGVEFSHTDQKALLGVLALVVGYYLAAFVLYAASDFISWHIRRAEAYGAFISSPEFSIRLKPRSELERFKEENTAKIPRANFSLALSWPVYGLCMIFEFLLPLAVGVYAIVALLATHPSAPPLP